MSDQQKLFSGEQYGQTCSKCGHPRETHGGPRGYCHEAVGNLECKCGSFAHHDMSKLRKLRPDLFHDRRDEG